MEREVKFMEREVKHPRPPLLHIHDLEDYFWSWSRSAGSGWVEVPRMTYLENKSPLSRSSKSSPHRAGLRYYIFQINKATLNLVLLSASVRKRSRDTN